MSILKRFAADNQGTVATMFAVASLPLLLAVGSAVDYDRAVGMRTRVQAAVDATALAMARDAADLSDADLQAKGTSYFEAAFASSWADVGPGVRASRDFNRTSLSVTKTADKKVVVDVRGVYPTTFMKMAGKAELDLAATGQAAWGTRKIEVALVLDNTGSMASANKITELKKAAKNLVTTLQGVAKEPDQVKIALVPFNTQVRVDTSWKNETWLDFSTFSVNKASWTGCIADRNSGYDTNDNPLAKYPAVKTCQFNGITPLKPLSADFAGMRTAIDAMTADGNTNITIGLAWGLASLSPGAPLTGGAAFGSSDVEKFIILLTDGDNTQNRFGDSVYQMDQRTRTACDEVKKPANGVTLYTVRVINGNAALLRGCATDSSKYFDVTSASQLDGVFKTIAGDITSIRLTM